MTVQKNVQSLHVFYKYGRYINATEALFKGKKTQTVPTVHKPQIYIYISARHVYLL